VKHNIVDVLALEKVAKRLAKLHDQKFFLVR